MEKAEAEGSFLFQKVLKDKQIEERIKLRLRVTKMLLSLMFVGLIAALTRLNSMETLLLYFFFRILCILNKKNCLLS